MKRFLVLCLIALSFGQLSYGQDVYKIASVKKEPNGTEVFTTNLKVINMSFTNEVSMAMRAKSLNGRGNLFLYVTVPYKEIDIPESATLEFTLEEGESIVMPVERKMVWKTDHEVVRGGKGSANVIRIPFCVTDDQLDKICASHITYVTIHSVPSEVSFKPKSKFLIANVTKTLRTELGKMLPAEIITTPQSNPAIAASTNNTSGPKYQIHDTPRTKVFTVNKLSELQLGYCYDGIFSVYEPNTDVNHIFNKDGIHLGNCTSYELLSFHGGKYAICGHDIINTKGEKVAYIDYPGPVKGFLDGVGTVEWGGFIYINEKGERIYKELPTSLKAGTNQVYSTALFPLVENRRIFIGGVGKMGYIDSKGTIVIPATYSNASDFSEGIAAVAIREGSQDTYGFIDLSGNYVIPPKFSNPPSDFREGYAYVQKKNGSYVFIDRSGNAVSPEYEKVTPFSNGHAWVKVKDDGYYIVDKQFNQTLKMADISSVIPFPDYNLVMVNGMKERPSGLYSYDNGEFILQYWAEKITGDVLPCYLSDSSQESGYINLQGEVIIRFVESEF